MADNPWDMSGALTRGASVGLGMRNADLHAKQLELAERKDKVDSLANLLSIHENDPVMGDALAKRTFDYAFGFDPKSEQSQLFKDVWSKTQEDKRSGLVNTMVKLAQDNNIDFSTFKDMPTNKLIGMFSEVLKHGQQKQEQETVKKIFSSLGDSGQGVTPAPGATGTPGPGTPAPAAPGPPMPLSPGGVPPGAAGGSPAPGAAMPADASVTPGGGFSPDIESRLPPRIGQAPPDDWTPAMGGQPAGTQVAQAPGAPSSQLDWQGMATKSKQISDVAMRLRASGTAIGEKQATHLETLANRLQDDARASAWQDTRIPGMKSGAIVQRNALTGEIHVRDKGDDTWTTLNKDDLKRMGVPDDLTPYVVGQRSSSGKVEVHNLASNTAPDLFASHQGIKRAGEEIEAIRGVANGLRDDDISWQQITAALPSFKTGSFGDQLGELSKMADRFGMKKEFDSITGGKLQGASADTIRQASAALSLKWAERQKGGTSRDEFKTITNAGPSLFMSQQGIETANMIRERVKDRAENVEEMANNWENQYGGLHKKNEEGRTWFQVKTQYLKDNSIMTDEIKDAIRGSILTGNSLVSKERPSPPAEAPGANFLGYTKNPDGQFMPYFELQLKDGTVKRFWAPGRK